MVDQSPLRLWSMRATFLGLGLLIILAQLMPLDTTPHRFAPPDFLICLSFAWALRRPEYAPALSIAAIALLADFLFQRPPGLGAALILAGAETLRAQARGLRDQPFPMEWLSVAIVISGVFVAYRLAAAIFMIPQAPLFLTAIQALGTIVVYPLVVFLSYLAFGLRKSAPGEVDTLGHKL